MRDDDTNRIERIAGKMRAQGSSIMSLADFCSALSSDQLPPVTGDTGENIESSARTQQCIRLDIILFQ